MAEEHHIEPVRNVQVAALLCECGMCGHGILIDYEALDQETGSVDAMEDYGHCPECDTIFDAQAVRFSAMLEQVEKS